LTLGRIGIVLKTRRGEANTSAFNTCQDRSPGPSPDAASGLQPNTRRLRCRDADRFALLGCPSGPSRQCGQARTGPTLARVLCDAG